MHLSPEIPSEDASHSVPCQWHLELAAAPYPHESVILPEWAEAHGNYFPKAICWFEMELLSQRHTDGPPGIRGTRERGRLRDSEGQRGTVRETGTLQETEGHWGTWWKATDHKLLLIIPVTFDRTSSKHKVIFNLRKNEFHWFTTVSLLHHTPDWWRRPRTGADR